MEHLHGMPASLRPLVQEIEDAAHAEITLRYVPDLVPVMMARFAAANENAYPEIQYRECVDAVHERCPEPWTVFCHELLHLRRYLVDRVPALSFEGLEIRHNAGASLGHTFTVIELESTLEHLVIERQIPNYGFSFPDYKQSLLPWWRDRMRNPVTFGGPMLRWMYLLRWLESDILTDDSLACDAARPVLEHHGLVKDAETLSKRLRAVLHSKDAVVFLTLQAIGIPLDVARLAYAMRTDAGAVRMIPREFTVETQQGPQRFTWKPRSKAGTVTYRSSSRGA